MTSSYPEHTTARVSLGSHDDIESNLEWQEKYIRDSAITGVITAPIFSSTPKPVDIDDPIEYPEGGLRAWSVVFATFMVQLSAFGYKAAFGVYQDYYTRVYMTEHSASAISWIGSTSAFLLLATGLFAGRLYDKGYCMALLYAGTALTSLSLFMLSLVKSNHYVEALLCQGFGLGLGAGLLFVPASAIISQYFKRRRVLVMPIVSAGVPMGSVITPILINSLLQKSNLTFPIVIRIYASFVTSILVIACWFIRPRLSPQKKPANIISCVKRFLKDIPYVSMTTGLFLFGMAMFFPIYFLQLAAIKHGLGKTFAFYSLAILNGSGFLGRMSCGFLSNMIGIDVLAIVSSLICGGIVFAFVKIGSVATVVLVAVIYGYFIGLLVAAMYPLTASLTEDMEELGLRIGIAFTFLGLGQLIGPPIIGALLVGYHWVRPAVFSGVLFVLAAGCFTATRVIICARKTNNNM